MYSDKKAVSKTLGKALQIFLGDKFPEKALDINKHIITMAISPHYVKRHINTICCKLYDSTN